MIGQVVRTRPVNHPPSVAHLYRRVPASTWVDVRIRKSHNDGRLTGFGIRMFSTILVLPRHGGRPWPWCGGRIWRCNVLLRWSRLRWAE